MFSVQQKRDIAEAVQQILRATQHPELPKDREIRFDLDVFGVEPWSWTNIQNNEAVVNPDVNPHNERQAELQQNKDAHHEQSHPFRK